MYHTSGCRLWDWRVPSSSTMTTLHPGETMTPPEGVKAPAEIICGYCETKNIDTNPVCISCGGPLADEVTQRRNTQFEELSTSPTGFGITMDEAVDAFRVFGGI